MQPSKLVESPKIGKRYHTPSTFLQAFNIGILNHRFSNNKIFKKHSIQGSLRKDDQSHVPSDREGKAAVMFFHSCFTSSSLGNGVAEKGGYLHVEDRDPDDEPE